MFSTGLKIFPKVSVPIAHNFVDPRAGFAVDGTATASMTLEFYGLALDLHLVGQEVITMSYIRNRHYCESARELLPWGDPYILQLFASSGDALTNQSQPTAQAINHGRWSRLAAEAHPPLCDPQPDFDVSRRIDNLPCSDEPIPDESIKRGRPQQN